MTAGVFESEASPQLVWDTINAYQRTAALRSAIELNLFTLIGDGSETAPDLALRSGASSRGVRILCDYLTVIGFLRKEVDAYRLTATASLFLNRNSPACLADIVRFINSPRLMAGFENFTETVRQGCTRLQSGGVNEPEFSEWVTFAENMKSFMAGACELIAAECYRVSGSQLRILDVAAGHGLFGISVAVRIPEAEITALDWPNVLSIAKRNAESAGIRDRYRLLPGDVRDVGLGNGYDVVLLTNLLHHFDRPTCAQILERLQHSMAPRGQLMILEFIPNEDRVTPPIPASFGLMMLALTESGDVYTARDLDELVSAAGFSKPVLVPVPQSPQHLMICEKSARPIHEEQLAGMVGARLPR